ncbi:hypothetical protein B0H21DRAFT_406834 [Amylocystis lapponica]|nr:hypothetical protein B0H21DRAFT_406834 [Amylocystis lapponica]
MSNSIFVSYLAAPPSSARHDCSREHLMPQCHVYMRALVPDRPSEVWPGIMSIAPSTIPPLFEINLTPTMGVVFIGLLLGAIFHGITTLQSLFYYQTYPKDKLFLKVLVAVLWMLDSLSIAMVAYSLYTYLILDFANPFALEYMSWGIVAEPMVSGTVALIVHLFLSHRIWSLNKKWAPFAACLQYSPFFRQVRVLSLLTHGTEDPGLSALAYVAAIKSLGANRLWTTDEDIRWIAITADVTTSVLDLVIACTICLQLYLNRTGFGRTEKMITLLSLYTINSGLMTTFVSLGDMIAYLVAPNTLTFEIFNVTVSKAYANTLLATLNTRQSIRGRAVDADTTGIPSVVFKQHTKPSTYLSTDRNNESATDVDVELSFARPQESVGRSLESKPMQFIPDIDFDKGGYAI